MLRGLARQPVDVRPEEAQRLRRLQDVRLGTQPVLQRGLHLEFLDALSALLQMGFQLVPDFGRELVVGVGPEECYQVLVSESQRSPLG